MEGQVPVLVMNVDEEQEHRIKSCLGGSAYDIDIGSSYLESLQKLKESTYRFVIIHLNGHGDAALINEARRRSSSADIIVLTKIDPRSEVDWDKSNGKMAMKDYLRRAGVESVVSDEAISVEDRRFELLLDDLLRGASEPNHP